MNFHLIHNPNNQRAFITQRTNNNMKRTNGSIVLLFFIDAHSLSVDSFKFNRSSKSSFVPSLRLLNSNVSFSNGKKSNLRYKCIGAQHNLQASTSSTAPDDENPSLSAWSPGKWKVTLLFRRQEDASPLITKLMGNEWGSNGAQLVLPLEILVNAEVPSDKDTINTKKKSPCLWLGGKPTGSIECTPQNGLNETSFCSSYINDKGQQNVQISPGPWRLEPPIPLMTSSSGKVLQGQASTLRFSLTLNTAIQRNSIKFPDNQMLLLQSNTFREKQYETGVNTLRPYQYAKENSQKMLDEQLNHDSGDRRLDGTDLLQTLEGYKDVAGLVLKRDESYRKWKDVEGVLPLMDSSELNYDIETILDDDRWGVWPGDTDLMTIERGIILAVVEKKEKSKGLFSWIENGDEGADTVMVGTWTAEPVWDDEED